MRRCLLVKLSADRFIFVMPFLLLDADLCLWNSSLVVVESGSRADLLMEIRSLFDITLFFLQEMEDALRFPSEGFEEIIAGRRFFRARW